MSVVTEVSVINDALTLLGGRTISSRTQNAQEAIIANRIFDQARDAVLRAHPWNFAIKRAELTVDSTTPTFEYDYRYTIPSDCLRVLGVTTDIDGTQHDDVPHSIEDGYILCDESAAIYVIYIYKNDTPDDWDTKFAEALAAKLAYMMSYAITQSSKVREDMRKLMYERLSEARSFDGMEGTMHWLIADEWMDSRD